MSWALCFHKSNLLIEQQYSLGSTLSFIVPVNVECDMAVALSDFSDILLSIYNIQTIKTYFIIPHVVYLDILYPLLRTIPKYIFLILHK